LWHPALGHPSLTIVRRDLFGDRSDARPVGMSVS
jgi:hypothetical protein